DNASVRFGTLAVLRDLTLAVSSGETLAVIGESGCGKTVMLKLIIGLLRPTAGKVTFDGRVLPDLGERDLVRQRLRIGFLFQQAALFDSLTVGENVAFGLRARGGQTEAAMADVVRQRLQEVGLPQEVEGKMPAELSG